MKNLPYEQNVRQRKEMLQNYQKEITDIKDRKMQEKQKRLAEERQYVNQINQKLEEEKIKQQNLKAIRVNEKMNEYQQFQLKKQEEKNNKFKNKYQIKEEPLFEKEKHKYLNNMNYNTDSHNTINQQNPIQTSNNHHSNNVGYTNPYDNNLRNYTPPNLGQNLNQHPITNEDYHKVPHIMNQNVINDHSNPNSLKQVNEYSPYENNQSQNNTIDHNQIDNNKDKIDSSLNMNNNYNKNQGLYAGYEDLKELDFSDPNFDYNKYDEMMQKYAREYLNKDEEKKTLGREDESGKIVNENLHKQMENLNINQNHPSNYDRENPYHNQDYYQYSGNPNDLYPSKPNNNHDNVNNLNNNNNNIQYHKPIDQNFNVATQNIRNEYSNVNTNNKGSTPQQNNRNLMNIKPHDEEQFTRQEIHVPANYNDPYTIQNNLSNVAIASNQTIHDNNRPRSSSQNPYANSNNQNNNSYDPSRMINNYQYNQMIYLKNKSNNQVSNITNSNYNFERITPELKNHYNTVVHNNNYDGNTVHNNNNQNRIPNSTNINPIDFNNILRNKKYEQQMLYKNFLDSQVKEKTYLKDNYKVNEFISLNKKERNLQINPYTSKNYDFNYTNLNSNIITPMIDNRNANHIPQPNYYQERPVVINNNTNHYQDKSNNHQPLYNNNNNNYNRPSSGKLQMVGNNIMR